MSSRPEPGAFPDLARMSDDAVRATAESAERLAVGYVRSGQTTLAKASWVTFRVFSAELATREQSVRGTRR